MRHSYHLMVTPGSDTEREELNRRHQELRVRLQAAPSDDRDTILEEMRVIMRKLRELNLDDRLRSSMDGGSEG